VDSITKTANMIYSYGVSLVTLHGGEPLLHPNIKQIISKLKDIGFDVGVVTNGTVFKKGMLDFLNKNEVDIEISILGPNGYDDLLRGCAGKHSRVLRNLKLLYQNNLESGIVSNVTRFCFIEKDYFTKIIEEIYSKTDVRIRYFGLQRIMPTSRNKEYFNDLFFIPKEGLNKIFEQMSVLEKVLRVPEVYTVDAFPLCVVDEKYHKYVKPCAYGIELFAVSGKGDFRRCPCSDVSLGNIFVDGLKEIWESFELSNFRSLKWLPGKCKHCNVLKYCLGGCSKSSIESLGKDHYPDIYIQNGSVE
jgi:radical SAM protein with 4Fe4S-binding SPASM domain